MNWLGRYLQTIAAMSLAIVLSACASSAPQEASLSLKHSSKDIYRSLNGASFIPCYKFQVTADREQSQCGERLYSRPVLRDYETGMPAAEDSWADCSDADFSCVANPVYLMAVPKTGLKQGLVYETHGSQLTVLKCFEASFVDPGECQAALISSICVGSCTCRPEQAPRFGVLFYYAADVGVSTFLFTPSIDQMDGAIPERSWSLIAEEGFLKHDFDLRQTGAGQPCHWN